jgi:hypothetical protein
LDTILIVLLILLAVAGVAAVAFVAVQRKRRAGGVIATKPGRRGRRQ